MGRGETLRDQDAVNCRYLRTEAEQSQTHTVDAGLHFLEGFIAVGGYMLAYYGVTTYMPTMIVQTYDQARRCGVPSARSRSG